MIRETILREYLNSIRASTTIAYSRAMFLSGPIRLLECTAKIPHMYRLEDVVIKQAPIGHIRVLGNVGALVSIEKSADHRGHLRR